MSEKNMTVMEATTAMTVAAVQSIEGGFALSNPELVCDFFAKVYEVVQKCDLREWSL